MNNNIENHLTLTQKYIILLLNSNYNQPVRGKLWFQKELFLIAENIPRLEGEAEFEGDLMGPYSENADAELDQLRNEGIVKINGKISLTPFGQKVAERLLNRTSKETKEVIADMKLFLNDLSKDELLGFIYFSYPQMTIESIEFAGIKAKREEIALSLYRKRKVSLGKAALISGLSQEDFIRKAETIGITVFSE